MAIAASVCAGLYVGTHPAGLSLRYATCLALAFGVSLIAARAVALERSYEVCHSLFLPSSSSKYSDRVRSQSGRRWSL